MFWSGNFIVVRELNFLLKEENVTLSQVLEADDILQECKADNKALMQFLTRPDILAELITLITEEPPASVELTQQYRHASIACEVLTSPLSSLSDRLSLDTAQMNRLCDFINRDPPLNPLLASYFSKTIEMLLERNAKQDWYLYHIVCLRVLDFFKSRRDFLPNLLRHMSTSAIADIFKYFIRLDDLFNKIVMEWLEEHQFIECLIQIVCGTYSAEAGAGGGASPDQPEKGQREPSEKHNHADSRSTEDGSHDHENNECPPEREQEQARAASRRRARTAAVAAANAAELLCELVSTGCAAEGAAARSRTSWALLARLAGGAGAAGAGGGPRALLQAVFTCAPCARAAALAHGARLLRTLLDHAHTLGCEGGAARAGVELAVAPHLPLLHQALLRDPALYSAEESGGDVPSENRPGVGAGAGAVGAARIQTAALLAHLASSEVEEVATTMLTLGTPGVLVDMFFRYPHNNFLHATLLAFVRNALANPAYRSQYTTHLLVECDLLTRLMDAFEENENKQSGCVRAGYMGHVTLCLAALHAALAADGGGALPAALAPRWRAFVDDKLEPAHHHYTQPLGGSYPSENSYEADSSITDRLTSYYEATSAEEGAAAADVDPDRIMMDDDEERQYRSAAEDRFLELSDQRFDDDMWDDAPEAEDDPPADALREVLGEGSPWESSGAAETGAEPAADEGGWAQFEALGAALPPADPFADSFQGGFPHYWPYEAAATPSTSDMSSLGAPAAAAAAAAAAVTAAGCSSLASNLLTAMSGMSPAAIANIVNANLHLDVGVIPPADLAPIPHHNKDGEIASLPIEAKSMDITAMAMKPADAIQAENITSIPSGDTEKAENEEETKTEVAKSEQVEDALLTGDIVTSDNVTDALVSDTSVVVVDAKVTDLPVTATDANAVAESNETDSSSPKESVCNTIEPRDASKPPANSTDFQMSSEESRTDSSLLSECKDLNDITEKFNDISLQEQKADTNSPAKSPTETILENEKVLNSCESVLEVAEDAER